MGCLPLKKIQNPDDQKENNQMLKDDETFNNIKETEQVVSKMQDLLIHSSLIVQQSSLDPFDVYDFLKVLGEGSFGKVMKVIHRKLNIIRAMKIIEKGNSGSFSEENTKELIAEINILKSLDHPNIIKIYEYFNTKNKIYISFEFCSGGELFDQLVKIKNFREKNIAYIMKQLISSVAFLHANGIIHRDLKPENIMIENPINPGEETFTIKLIDFGTSQIYKNKNNTKKKVFTEMIGSSYYMAPEVLGEKYNEKCDCWSLGVIMYMLITGTPPFNGNSDDEIFKSILTKDLTFPDKLFKKVSDDAKDLLQKLLCRDVSKRISSQEALEHKWFKIPQKERNSLTEINPEKMGIISENLKKFNSNLKFQQACVSYIVHNMVKKEEIEEYRKIFQEFDTNSDGRLSREELIKGFSQTMSEGEAKDEVNRLIEHIDCDKNNYIEFEEFLSAFMDKKMLLKEENLMETFMLFDKDGSGKITVDELKMILSGNSLVEDKVWNEMLLDIDNNSDGEISYSEFKKIMKKMIN